MSSKQVAAWPLATVWVDAVVIERIEHKGVLLRECGLPGETRREAVAFAYIADRGAQIAGTGAFCVPWLTVGEKVLDLSQVPMAVAATVVSAVPRTVKMVVSQYAHVGGTSCILVTRTGEMYATAGAPCQVK